MNRRRDLQTGDYVFGALSGAGVGVLVGGWGAAALGAILGLFAVTLDPL